MKQVRVELEANTHTPEIGRFFTSHPSRWEKQQNLEEIVIPRAHFLDSICSD
jgi:hypothetical protein